MTDAAVGVGTEALDERVPYSAGPVSRFLGWMERPPASRPWVVIAGLTILLVAWAHVVLWATGALAPGRIDVAAFVLVLYLPFPLVGGVVGRRILRTALTTFWPATGWPETERPAWLYRFLNVPLRQEVAGLVVGLAVGVAATVAIPPGVLPPQATPFDVDLAFGPMFLGGYVLTAMVAVMGFHWLRLVAEIHRDATAIDPFDRGPIYAFSRLTVFVGLTVLAGTYYTLTVNLPFIAGNLAAQSLLPVIGLLGAAAFVVPLWGIHGRLVRTKDGLLHDVDQRIRAAATDLYGRVDARSYEDTKAIHEAVAGLGIVRDRIRELPTWPWPPQLLRGFLSALLLPVIVYILSRAAAGLISL